MKRKVNNTIIPDHVIVRWQEIVDVISDLASVPSVMINRLDPPELEIFCSSTGPDNPFPSGTRMPLLGIYCETAAKLQRRVWITDARKDPQWSDSPTAKAGIYAYLGYPLLWPDGNVFGTLCVVDTKENQWSERIDNLVACFRDTVETYLALVYATESANAANRAKSEFLAVMSHDIRTPMTAILGFAEVLMENRMNREQADAVATIKRNGEYLIELINDILDLSKIEAGKLDIENIPCSPCEILADVVSLMANRARAKNLTFDIRYISPVPKTIHSDPTRLYQVLINLIGNAIKFTDAGGVCLTVRLINAEPDRPMLQFDVIDSGIGINEKQILQLFQPFSQADISTTRKFGGTGLGLPISKRLGEELGGEINVKSVPGKGSVFTVTVETGPLDGVDLVTCPTAAVVPSDVSARPTDNSHTIAGCRILLAEDGLDNQRLLSLFLKKAGAEVVAVDNGQAAYDSALAARDIGNPFDVILMDMQMPEMNGYDATRKLRNEGYRGSIVALTAYAMTNEREKCLVAGCDDFASKPIDRKTIVSLVAQHFERSKGLKD